MAYREPGTALRELDLEDLSSVLVELVDLVEAAVKSAEGTGRP